MRLGGRCLGPRSQKEFTWRPVWAGEGKVHESPGGADSTGRCVPSCGGRVWEGSGYCAVRQLWGQRLGSCSVSREGRGQGLGTRAPQDSLLILPTAHSSAAQASLAQCRAQGLPAWPGGSPSPSRVLSPGTQSPLGQLQACETARAPRGACAKWTPGSLPLYPQFPGKPAAPPLPGTKLPLTQPPTHPSSQDAGGSHKPRAH